VLEQPVPPPPLLGLTLVVGVAAEALEEKKQRNPGLELTLLEGVAAEAPPKKHSCVALGLTLLLEWEVVEAWGVAVAAALSLLHIVPAGCAPAIYDPQRTILELWYVTAWCRPPGLPIDPRTPIVVQLGQVEPGQSLRKD